VQGRVRDRQDGEVVDRVTNGIARDTLVATLREDGTLLLRLDDEGPNTLRPEVFHAIRARLDEHPSAPVLLTGRSGMFSAGLDLKWMAAAPRAGIGELLEACGQTLVALWLHPRPVVAAATGHAIAAGTILCLATDHVVAAEGSVWGLVETAKGMELPQFAIELAAARLSPHDLDRALLSGERMDAARAVTIGFADEVTTPDEVISRAEERLTALCALPAAAYAGNKRRLRSTAAERVLDGLTSDVAGLIDGFRMALRGWSSGGPVAP
jgi:enoyl-CoA hydratase